MATEEYMTSQTYSATIGGIVYNVTAAVSGAFDFATNKTFGADVTVQGNLIADAITGPTTVTGNLSTTGDLEVGGGDITIASAKALIRGSGSPEGAVTAPVGCIYERTDGGTSTSFYIKESGSGNTGWVAHGGTTGWNGHDELSDIVYDDIVISPASIRIPTVGGPSSITWKSDLEVPGFDAGGSEYAYFAVQLPHNYVPGTNLLFHVHFTNDTNITDGQTVVFRLRYSWGPVWGAMSALANADATFTNNAGARTGIAAGQLSGTTIIPDTHMIAGGATITGTNMGLSTVLYGRLERLSSDTYTGEALLLSADMHIQKNRLGSENEYTG